MMALLSKKKELVNASVASVNEMFQEEEAKVE